MIVLDTHAFVWWASGNHELMSPPALSAINREIDSGQLIVSSISCWELAMLVARDRISLSMDVAQWLKVVAQIDAVRFVPVDNEIAVKSVELPGDFHKDPADRIIVATARHFGAPVVSADEKIREYSHVRSVW